MKNTRQKVENRIVDRIRRSRQSVFLRRDFSNIGGYEQVGRTLRRLVEKEVLVRIGYGLYARAEKSSLTGKIRPDRSLIDLGREYAQRLGYKTVPTRAQRDYNERRSTQVPTGRVIGVEGRITRKVGYDGVRIYYEEHTRPQTHS